jgi:predicted AAA+ superfamily ATPase
VALLELTPLLCAELTGTARAADRWFWGGFPPIHGLRDSRARGEWFNAYVSTFLERDLPAPGIGLLFFWRTQAGAEVDLLIVEGRRILPIEIKGGSAVDRYAVAGLRQCMKDLGLRRGLVVSTALDRRRLSPDIEIVPWADIASGRFELF